MIDKLRRAYYRRRYGPEEGERLALVEEAIVRLYDRGQNHWAGWLDRLPPEWQLPAIEWLEACRAARKAMGDVVDTIAKAQRLQTHIESLELQDSLSSLGLSSKSDHEKLCALRKSFPTAAAAVEQANDQARALVAKAKQLAEPLAEQGFIDSVDPMLG